MPKRKNLTGLYEQCIDQLHLKGVTVDSLGVWLRRHSTEWGALKRTLGTEATPSPKSGAAAVGAGPSLDAYMMGKQRASCRICQLPPALREQLTAGARKYTRAELIEWLAKGHGVVLTVADFTAHSGRH